VLNHVGAEGDFQYYAYSYSENTDEQDASELDAQATEFAQRSGIPSVKR
jgi:hypothetical protein